MKTMTLLNGKELKLNNFGDDPSKVGFNRWGVNVPTFEELSRPVKAHLNSLSIGQAGYEYAITTLTYIKSQVVEQKFYEVAPSDYMPVVVGEGAWLKELVFNSAYLDADDFETGIVDSSRPYNRKPKSDIEIIAHSTPIVSWNKAFDYSIMELNQAAKANIDMVFEQERARKKNWDLGIQKTAFLGSSTKAEIKGLYNAESVNVNNTFIQAPISGLSADNFQTLVSGLIKLYLANNNGTVMPDTFLMPLSDYVGMAAAASAAYPLISKLEYLQRAFQMITKNPNFKIGYTLYGDKSKNAAAGINAYRYILYRNQPETLEMNIPVAYTTTAFGTPNGFDFQNVAMGQFSGVFAKHPQEILYLDDTHTS